MNINNSHSINQTVNKSGSAVTTSKDLFYSSKDLQEEIAIRQSRKTVLQQQLAITKNLMDKTDSINNEKEFLWLQAVYYTLTKKLNHIE